MKKGFLAGFIFILIFVGLYFALEKKETVSADNKTSKKVQVLVSGYVPYTLTKTLAQDKADTVMLLPVNAEPHSFEPAPGSLVQMREADIFVFVSPRLEPWAQDLLPALPRGALSVELGQDIQAEKDPHIWMNFDYILRMAQTLTDTLCLSDEENCSFYRENLEKFKKDISLLDTSFQKGLATCQNRLIVHVGHLAFGYLAQRYGLELEALSGSSHDGEHSVKRLAGLVDKIREANIKTIFTEETLSSRLADTVRTETGVTVLPLYPVEHISKADFDAQTDYIMLMRRNLENLQKGLVCQTL